MSHVTFSAPEAYARLEAADCPAEMTVSGVLDFSLKSGRLPPSQFPERLNVDVLDLSSRDEFAFPRHVQCYELNLSNTSIRSLPGKCDVSSRLDLSQCEQLEMLPAGLMVGTLVLRGCLSLKKLPEGLDVWFLDMSGCWAFETWPQAAQIRSGRLQLGGCTALRSLPPYLNRLSALNVRECPNLISLPRDLLISGWLELGHSGLTQESELPTSLNDVQLRWGGINIDRRIVFHPEKIRVDEVLQERNAERRRVLLDRYGYGRFIRDANAEILDTDVDQGGDRQLLRVGLDGDEDLVAMSCFCPSTARQYVIRVPPSTSTCRQAAAWIAGFDNPDDYDPIQET